MLLGFICGGAVIYWFCGASMQAVTTGAYRAVEFIKKNMDLDKKEADIEDSKTVVRICTEYAQSGMWNIFIALMTITLAFAFFDPNFFVAYLISIAVFGLFQAIYMANAGGAWDNAKKLVEVDLKEKGTPLHAATVVGDTVGDPFKDTTSVALNPIIKFSTLFGLLAVEIAVEIKQAAEREHGDRTTRPYVGVVHAGRSRWSSSGGRSTPCGFRRISFGMRCAMFRLCTVAIILGVLAVQHSTAIADDAPTKVRPNILWISLEDISPDLGCYGDSYARTPVLDEFAKNGVRFTTRLHARARSAPLAQRHHHRHVSHEHRHAPHALPGRVAARCEMLYRIPARSGLLLHQQREDRLPVQSAADRLGRKQQPRPLAQAARPASHSSRCSTSTPRTSRRFVRPTLSETVGCSADERHDPAKANSRRTIPTRRSSAATGRPITTTSPPPKNKSRGCSNSFSEDGLAEDTIVWIWGDHGRGLPRGKRWVYDSGTHIPLLIRVPEKWRSLASPDGRADKVAAGSVNDDLIAIIDFGPTVLSLAGVDVPKHMHGRAFLGPQRGAPRKYLFAGRDRMDERYDLIRSVHDGRFHYIRNFMPHLPYAQHIGYMDEMPTMKEMRRLHAAGKLEGPPALFFRDTKPVEELYDTEADPHEIHNLADDPRHADKLAELREQLENWMLETGDLGMIPEPILDEAQRRDGEARPATGQRREDWRPSVWSPDLLDRWLALKEHDRESVPRHRGV